MPRGYPLKTPENVARAHLMREQGHTLAAIAEHLGTKVQTVSAWLTDPDGAKLRARKDQYAQECIDCGASTSGSEGRRDEPRCHPCAAKRSGAARKIWTREQIIAAMRWWNEEYGEPPAAPDWDPTRARRNRDEQRARRARALIAGGAIPATKTVYATWGSWNKAIIAAGFTPRAGHGGAGNQHRRRSMRSKAAA